MRTAWIIKLVLVLSVFHVGAQNSDKLKSDQQKLEQKISTTKKLLAKSQANTQSSLNDLKLIENQIAYREQLLKNYDDQIRSAELKVEEKQDQIAGLTDKIAGLKTQYKKLLLYAYKNRNKYGQIMFIFSADSYHEALKRNKYLKRIQDIQQKQLLLISQHQELIKEEIAAIDAEKEKKKVVIDEKRKERKEIEADRIKQQAIVEKFKAEEGKLLAQLRKDEQDKVVLKERINAAIRKEIAEAEAAARKKKEAEAKKTTAAKTTEAKTTVATKEETKAVIFTETAESATLSKSFEGNRGRLPWPVEKGTITENFGKNAHPTLKNVYTDNRGIDISAPKNAQVRAVFEGEVTSVLNIPGAGKVIIIKHGNYRTVYSNLQDTYVKAGDKVSTKAVIGALLVKEKESVSMAHFEIHQVSGSNVICLNPSLWISR